MAKRKSSPFKKAHQLRKGLFEAVTGAVIGFALAAIIDYFANDGIIPWYVRTGFTIFGIISSLFTIYKFKSLGILYISGWIAGSWLLKDILGPVDFVLLIVVPLGIILFRVWRKFSRLMKV
jgi:hypothetical protein